MTFFEDFLDQGHVVIYLDDILIFHDSLLTLHDLTHTVLQRLGKFDLYLNLRSAPLIKPPLNTWVSLLLMAKFAWTLPKSLALPSGLSPPQSKKPRPSSASATSIAALLQITLPLRALSLT